MDAHNVKRISQRKDQEPLFSKPSPTHDNSSLNQVSIDDWLGTPVADRSSAVLVLKNFLDLFGQGPALPQAKSMEQVPEKAAGQPESQDQQAPPEDPLAKYKAYLRETLPLCTKAQSQPLKADPKALAQVQPYPDVPTLPRSMAQPMSQTPPEEVLANFKAYLRESNRQSESMFSTPTQSRFEPLEAQSNPETQDPRQTDIQQSLEKEKLEHEKTRSQLCQAQIDLQNIQIQSSDPMECQLQAIQKDLEALKLQNNQKFKKLEEKFQESGCREIHDLLEAKEAEMDSLYREVENDVRPSVPLETLKLKTEQLCQDFLELKSKLEPEPFSSLKRQLERDLKKDIEFCKYLQRDIEYDIEAENSECSPDEMAENQVVQNSHDLQERLNLERQAKEDLEAQVKELQKSLDQERQAKEALQKSLDQKPRPAGLDKIGQVLLRTLNLETQAKKALEAQVQGLQNSLTQETEAFKEEIQELQECLDQEREDHQESKVCIQKRLEDIRVLNKIIDAKDYDFSVKIKNLQKTLDSESDVKKEMEEDMEDLKMIIATMNLDFDAEREMTSQEIQNYQKTIEDVHQELEILKEEKTQLDDDVTAKTEEIMELNKKLADFEVDIHHMDLLLKERNDEKKALSDDVTQKTARIQELIRMIQTHAIGC